MKHPGRRRHERSPPADFEAARQRRGGRPGGLLHPRRRDRRPGGRALPGRVGSSTYDCSPSALASAGSPDLRVAGVSGTGANGPRWSSARSARACTRPRCAGRCRARRGPPGATRCGSGTGRSISGAGLGGAPSVVPLTLASGSVSSARSRRCGSARRARGSPWSSARPTAPSQVWLGGVVRNQRRCASTTSNPITPQGVAVTDVAWNDPLKLFVIGRVAEHRRRERLRGAGRRLAVVAAQHHRPAADPGQHHRAPRTRTPGCRPGTTVWVQRAGAWASPGTGETPGVNPVYLE